MGYPAISLSNDGTDICGQLLSSPELLDLWPVLDEFEGKDYERVTTLATIGSNKTLETYIYTIKPEENV